MPSVMLRHIFFLPFLKLFFIHVEEKTMTSIGLCVDVSGGFQKPAHCDSTYDTSNLCDSYKGAVDALNANKTTDDPSPSLIFPIAKCEMISSSQVEEATNNGLDIQKLKANYTTFSSTSNSGKCNTTAYGVFNHSTGEYVDTVTNLYNQYFQDCNGTDDAAIKPYMQANASTDCPQVVFTPQCQDTSSTYYAKCKIPGWDYMDHDDSTTVSKWTYNMNSCTSDAFTGDSDGAVDQCTDACCIYASSSQDNSSINCNSCAEAAGGSHYTRTWDGSGTDPKPKITYTNDSRSITLPYCNISGGSTDASNQGVAISLSDAVSNENVSAFGDPSECMNGGQFDGKCQGITGCDGLWGQSDAILEYAPCRLGFSNVTTSASNPASNCPNLYTLDNAGQNCKWSWTGTGQKCTATALSPQCTIETSDQRLTDGDSGFPGITSVTLPEGAWVIAHQGSVPSGADGPNQTGRAICDPQDTTDSTNAWSMGCGRKIDGNLIGKATTFKLNTDGSWSQNTDVKPITSMAVDDSDDVRTCTFTLPDDSPKMYGFQHGFMPGYYNSTCVTNSSNVCGTYAPDDR